ncbi:hypothetical protein [Rhizobium sp. YTU87027]|uniref:hypothetical protein n=1 Tax=Rhizobium sp. YTU87027 TaxID=3417741 RepID=UPI003D6808D0
MTEILLKQGDWVAATVRKADTLSDLKGQYGEKLWIGVVDVTDTVALRQPEPPLRLTLGSDAYEAVTTALHQRLKALETQKDIAFSTDFTN